MPGSPPTIKVYHGVINKIDGPPSGTCAQFLFSGWAVASWDQNQQITFDRLAPADRSLPSCDVTLNAPEVGDFCELWLGPEGKLNLFLKTVQMPAIECV